jgi:hypothetical protein
MLDDEQIAMVASELRLPRIAVRFAATQRDSHGGSDNVADLIADLAAQVAAAGGFQRG